MDQERDDYADNELHPSRGPSLQSVAILLLIFILSVTGALAWYWFGVLVPAKNC